VQNLTTEGSRHKEHLKYWLHTINKNVSLLLYNLKKERSLHGVGQSPGFAILFGQELPDAIQVLVSKHHSQLFSVQESQLIRLVQEVELVAIKKTWCKRKKHSEQQNHSQLRTHVRAFARILAPSVDDTQYPGCESEEGGKKFKSTRLVPLISFVAMRGVPYGDLHQQRLRKKK
jgi:hypothetical protein